MFDLQKGCLLADEFLRNIIEQEFKIPRDVSAVWVKQFKDGARASGLFHSRSDGKIQIAESPMFAEGTQEPPLNVVPKVEEPARLDGDGSHSLALPSHEPTPPAWRLPASGHCTRIELSDGRRAEISIPDRLNARDAEKLKKALQGVSVIIDSMVSDEGKL